MFLVCGSAFAQSERVFIKLFNGDILYGEIIESKEGENLTIKDKNDSIRIIPAVDITKIAKSESEFGLIERNKAKKARILFETLHETLHPSSTLKHTPTTNYIPTGEIIKLAQHTSIPMTSNQEVLARKVLVGDKITFMVSTNIYQDGKLVIPAGTKAYARVTKARKSIPIGIQGRLEFVMDYLELHNGQRINLEGRDIKIKGKNRTRMAFGVALVTLGFGYFIPGTKAVLPQGYEVVAHTLSEQEIMM